MKPTNMKSRDELEAEWNRLASLRNEQIENKKDLSYLHVLMPEIVNIVESIEPPSIIDVGCGCGHLTRELLNYSSQVTGVDISQKSVEYTKKKVPSNTPVFEGSLGEYIAESPNEKFELVICNMVLQCIPDMGEFIRDVKKVLTNDGNFVFSIPHPCFWPRYWNYENEDWFNYMEEISIETEFKISLDSDTQLKSTHIHRPLSRYLCELSKYDMSIVKGTEPMPSESIQEKYPEPWRFPRFLICVAKSL